MAHHRTTVRHLRRQRSHHKENIMSTNSINTLVGRLFANKARDQQAITGTQQAAKNLRKQGVPLYIALMVLTGRV